MVLLGTGARYGFRAALPFVAGVIMGKQLIIWPVGFGLLQLANQAPMVFSAEIRLGGVYLLVGLENRQPRLSRSETTGEAPGFWAGLIVHPLNPKAWAMIIAGFTGFVAAGTPTFNATFTIALCLLLCQVVLHPIWTFAGDRIAPRG